jgi:sugar phosphate isomerase/epimerase
MAYLTANGAAPDEAVHIAAEAGYELIGLRLLPAGPGDVVPPLMDDDALFARTKTALRDTGIEVADAEMVRVGEHTQPSDYLAFLARAAELGTRHILVAMDDADLARRNANFAALCEHAAGFGLTADLEFMPWTALRTIAEARAVLDAVQQPNAAILFDCLHFDRCGSTLDELAAIPPAQMNYVQLCDGPVEYDRSDAELIRVARTARLIPGEGGIDFAGICARVPAHVTISVEVPNRPQAEAMGRVEFARAALAASKRFMGEG